MITCDYRYYCNLKTALNFLYSHLRVKLPDHLKVGGRQRQSTSSHHQHRTMQSSTIATRAICRPTALLKRFPGPALGIAPSARRPARPAVTVPRAAAAAAAAPVPEAVWEPTGVPLVDELAGFKTLQDSGLHAIKLVAAALVGAYVGSWVLNAIASKVGRQGPIN